MNRTVRTVLVVALLVLVVSVFISPAVDLEPTALRVLYWIMALFASFALVRVALSGLHAGLPPERIKIVNRSSLFAQSSPLIDLNCARLC